jgi:hypothetical protein
MFHVQTLDVLQVRGVVSAGRPCVCPALRWGDGQPASTCRLSINLNIAEGTGRFGNDQRKFFVTASGSAFECAAILDALQAVGISDAKMSARYVLLQRIVSMLTKIASPTPTLTPTAKS